ncbi:hypothetical protein BLNAU_9636 [Blattamonas nauphoetae]|uniref:Uncharacterized protein n=1 Tax=Blattamonas nauphoetae TaxID=2049346 RepID=A0ABQ9XV96_9EUKA|nr:hypothetical protein BLNAU_9636 [Blattamonas nauphoetae]
MRRAEESWKSEKSNGRDKQPERHADKDSESGSEWRRENEDEPTSEEDQTRIEIEETTRESWEEQPSPPALQPTADKHGLVLSNTIIANSNRDEQIDDFSRLEDSFVARPKPNSSLQEKRGERKESPADLTRHTQPNSTLELEHLLDTSASSASNADLLRMIDSLKATLAEAERPRSADKANNEKELRTKGSVSAEEHSELTRLKEENARLTETMSDFQVRAASLTTDKSTPERSLEQTRQKMEMVQENNPRLEERLEETKREVDEWIEMNEKSHSIETLHTNIDQLTTERDTLQANLTATNQSLDESNQRIDTLSLQVSSLLAQNPELEHLLSKDWFITTDTQTECVGVSESAAQLASIEKFKPASITSHRPHYLDDMRKVREWRVVEQARKFNEYISSQVGTAASLTATNENTDGQKSILDKM